MVDVVHLRKGARPEPLAAGPDTLIVGANRLDTARVAKRFRELIGNHGVQPSGEPPITTSAVTSPPWVVAKKAIRKRFSCITRVALLGCSWETRSER